MRICLFGQFSRNPDEGMQNVSRNIGDRLALKHNIMAVSPRDVFKWNILNSIRSFQPELVHYIHGPTFRSLILLQLIKLITSNKPKTIASATRPYFSKFSQWAVSLLGPDLILTQSIKFERFFRKRNCKTQFMPNGVDCKKFSPASPGEKACLRNRFGLPKRKRIALHVGHIRHNRNLEILKRIQNVKNVLAVVVASTNESVDETLKSDLEEVGVKVYHEFFDDVSQFYKMADLYIFSAMASDKLPRSYHQEGAIDMPLSVLEAMACNLVIITTPFGALTRAFQPGDGLYFCSTDNEIITAVQSTRNYISCRTREKVLAYDWDTLVERLNSIYEDAINSRN